MSKTLDQLRHLAHSAASAAYVPYSGQQEAVVVLLSDGEWVPGVRVENASFSLTISALQNALTTARCLGRTDLVAFVATYAFRPEDRAHIGASFHSFVALADDVLASSSENTLPPVGSKINPFYQKARPIDPQVGILLARSIAARAYVPESGFPVGCLLVTNEGLLVPGVNVEHPDWSQILCAERNALGTLVTWEGGSVETVYLSCLNDSAGSPCGACRQVLAELAPGATVWMDRGQRLPEKSTTAHLLPGAFLGRILQRSP